MWLKAKIYRKGCTPKLQAKWQRPYKVKKSFDNGTYLIDLHGRTSTEHDYRLKLYTPAGNNWGRAPVIQEPNRQPAWPGFQKEPIDRKVGDQHEASIIPLEKEFEATKNTITESLNKNQMIIIQTKSLATHMRNPTQQKEKTTTKLENEPGNPWFDMEISCSTRYFAPNHKL